MGTCVSPLQSAEDPKDVYKVMVRFAPCAHMATGQRGLKRGLAGRQRTVILRRDETIIPAPLERVALVGLDNSSVSPAQATGPNACSMGRSTCAREHWCCGARTNGSTICFHTASPWCARMGAGGISCCVKTAERPIPQRRVWRERRRCPLRPGFCLLPHQH